MNCSLNVSPEVEESIFRLGQLIVREVVQIPDYANLKQSQISVCQRGMCHGN